MRHSSLPGFFKYKYFFSAAVFGLLALPVGSAMALDIKQAEQLATQADPSIERFKATSR